MAISRSHSLLQNWERCFHIPANGSVWWDDERKEEEAQPRKNQLGSVVAVWGNDDVCVAEEGCAAASDYTPSLELVAELLKPVGGYPPSARLPEGLHSWAPHPLLNWRSRWDWFHSHHHHSWYTQIAHNQQLYAAVRERALACLQRAARRYLLRCRRLHGHKARDAPGRRQRVCSGKRLVLWHLPAPDPREERRRRENVRRRHVQLVLRAAELPAIAREQEARLLVLSKTGEAPPLPLPSAVGVWRNLRNRKWHTDLARVNKRPKSKVGGKKKKKKKKKTGEAGETRSRSTSRIESKSPKSTSAETFLSAGEKSKRATEKDAKAKAATTGGIGPHRPPTRSLPSARHRTSVSAEEDGFSPKSDATCQQPPRRRLGSFSATSSGVVYVTDEEQIAHIVRQTASTSPEKPSQAGIQITRKDMLTAQKGSGNLYSRPSPSSRPLSAFTSSRPTSRRESLARGDQQGVQSAAEVHERAMSACMPASRSVRRLMLAVEHLTSQVDLVIAEAHNLRSQRPASPLPRHMPQNPGTVMGLQWAKTDTNKKKLSPPKSLAEAWDRLVDVRTDIGLHLGRAMGAHVAPDPAKPHAHTQLVEEKRELNYLQNQVSYLLQKVEANWLVNPSSTLKQSSSEDQARGRGSESSKEMGLRTPTPPLLSPSQEGYPSARKRSSQLHRQLKSAGEVDPSELRAGGEEGAVGLQSFQISQHLAIRNLSGHLDDGRREGGYCDNSHKELLFSRDKEEGGQDEDAISTPSRTNVQARPRSSPQQRHAKGKSGIQVPSVKQEGNPGALPDTSCPRMPHSPKKKEEDPYHPSSPKAPSYGTGQLTFPTEDLGAVGQALGSRPASPQAAAAPPSVKANDVRAASRAGAVMTPPESPKYAVTVRPRSASATAAASLRRRPRVLSAADKCRQQSALEQKGRRFSVEPKMPPSSHNKAFVPKLANHTKTRDFGKFYKYI